MFVLHITLCVVNGSDHIFRLEGHPISVAKPGGCALDTSKHSPTFPPSPPLVRGNLIDSTPLSLSLKERVSHWKIYLWVLGHHHEMTRRIGRTHRADIRSEHLFALETEEEGIIGSHDYISELPDECLARVFQFLCSGDRKTASLVSKQMLRVEGQSRRRLTLDAARSDLLPSLLSRFDAVTELVIRSHPRHVVNADDALILIGKHSGDRIKELGLIGVNVSCIGLELVARSFKKLERLTLRGSKTRIGDAEIWCIASKFVRLKKLCVKGCPVTDQGMKAFAWGCPDLVEIQVDKCRGVTSEGVELLRARRGLLKVNLDVGEIGADELELDSHGDGDDGGGGGGLQENGVDILPVAVSRLGSDGWAPVPRSRFGDFGGRRNFV